ncbi:MULTISPECIES: hypothetical protein [unclassified Moorena]|uniref:Uncharacterized protein n=1 Tax=Moorena producens 3L TaxID=489825 RepID=F4XL35_9CYAN|nr:MULTISPECIES: hypothetical protein [unclassified Moorena]EGJ34725.1 hypothetical protein LYNGBM3L_13570 [Moorena producens 3L]NEQ17048.1 hypothetical protein [Moorena sp. SIO3E2]NEP37070.1 hypothetical protein [Moorena sp. SIO3B2]NEQ09253.1 hypothetical protein [Moorena sp. SIO4E2]NER86637.1 hypothetical protein [Moorena sp. SIO3A2]
MEVSKFHKHYYPNHSAISYQLSAISYQLSAISYQLSAISYQLSAISYQLLAFGLWGTLREWPRYGNG